MGSQFLNSKENIDYVRRFLERRVSPTKYNKFNSKKYLFYEVIDSKLLVPFYFGKQHTKVLGEENVKSTNESFSDEETVVFKEELRQYQNVCAEKILKALHYEQCCILSCYTGFGKTVVALYVISQLQIPTLIIVSGVHLIKQWCEEAQNFLNKPLCALTAKNKYDSTGILMGVVNACNLDKVNTDHFKLLIVDEVHLQMTESISKKLLKTKPRYLIGMSATPYRNDDFNCLFEFFFGSIRISNPLFHKHTVFKVETEFTPLLVDTKNGIDWNLVLEEQARNLERNNIIINLVHRYNDRNILILVKRICQADYICTNLKLAGVKVCKLYGKHCEDAADCRVVVGTTAKIGTGFNCVKLNTLILGSDMVAYYIQFLGRVMREKENNAFVFDLVDDNFVLKRHFQERMLVYEKHGGVIQNYYPI